MSHAPVDAAAPDAPATRGRRRPTGRQLACGISLVAMCGLLLGGMLMPVPYVIESPGPAVDVLGEYDGTEVLTITGHETYPTEGELMMTTVSVDGGPGYDVTPSEVALSWFDPERSVLPRELVFPAGQTRQQNALQNTVQMSTSQQSAVAVALSELDIPYTRNVTVAGIEEGAPASGVLEAGDVILAIDGQSRETLEKYQELTRAAPAGQDLPVRVRRGEQELDLAVPTRSEDGHTRMGIVLAAGYDFPVDVHLSVEGIGGPSAGTMFALAIYDQLTPGALAGGRAIAGTGTIDDAGQVGAIGGIRQKMAGARAEGAAFFLAPAANCDEVVGHVPEGLSVVKVATFQDALAATEQIGTDGSSAGLPTCTS